MKPFNPFKQYRAKMTEVIIKPCSECHGTGIIKEEDEEIICSKCDGSGEITEKKQNIQIKEK